MANIIKKVIGNELLQEDLPNQNFVVNHQGGLEFTPASPDEWELPLGVAHSTFHPLEGNVTWIKAEARWTYSNPATPPAVVPDAQTIISLWGIMPDGSEHFVGEQIYQGVMGTNSTPLSITTFFDLKASGGQPPVLLEAPTGGWAGKVTLHLPFRVQNLESCEMYKTWMDPSYTNRYMFAMQSTNTQTLTNRVVGPIWLQTSSPPMNDFQLDVSFADSDAKTGLCFYRDPMFTTTPGQLTDWEGKARYFVKVPILPSSSSVKYIYAYYGGQGSNPTNYSSGLDTFKDWYGNTSFDDWEDGLYTGRTLPYRNWTAVTGTVAIESSAPITGSYSLKITGPGAADSSADTSIGAYQYHYIWPYIVEFDWKILSQGTGTYTPYVGIWYLHYKDASNMVRLDTYWDSGNSTQWLRLWKYQGGTPSEIVKVSLSASRLAAGSSVRVKILDHWDGHVQIWWNEQLVIDTTYTINWSITYLHGFAAMRDTSASWDNFIMYGPNNIVGAGADFNNPGERWLYSYDIGTYMEDNFDDNSINANKWVAVLGSGASTPVETNQELRVSGTGTHRAYLRSKNYVRAPWVAKFRAKKSENIEFIFDWAWGGINTSYSDQADTGYTLLYASWNNPTRFEIRKNQWAPSSPITMATANYTLDSNYHNYRVERSYNWIRVYIDDVYLIGLNSIQYKGGYMGLSARETPAAVNAYYDDFKCGGFLTARDAYTPVTPDSYSSESQYLYYSTPATAGKWVEGAPWHFRVKENYSGEYKSGDINLSAKNLVKLGYDNVDKYVALRFRVDYQGRSDTPFTLDQVEYHYNVE